MLLISFEFFGSCSSLSHHGVNTLALALSNICALYSILYSSAVIVTCVSVVYIHLLFVHRWTLIIADGETVTSR